MGQSYPRHFHVPSSGSIIYTLLGKLLRFSVDELQVPDSTLVVLFCIYNNIIKKTLFLSTFQRKVRFREIRQEVIRHH